MTAAGQYSRRAVRRSAVALLGALVLGGCGSGAAAVASRTVSSSKTTAQTSSTATVTPVVTSPAAPAVALSADAARVEAELHGIAQRGLVLGRVDAPVTIVEYADLLCTVCAEVHDNVLPAVIAGAVRAGRASLELRPVVGSSASRALALAAYSAGVQGRGWQFVQLAFRRIGVAGSPAEPAQALAAALSLDLRRWRSDLKLGSWKTDISGALDVVRVAGFGAYPVFLVARAAVSSTTQPPPYIVVTAPSSARSLERAIAEALARRG
jgi:protein-disulfide isomerase